MRAPFVRTFTHKDTRTHTSINCFSSFATHNSHTKNVCFLLPSHTPALFIGQARLQPLKLLEAAFKPWTDQRLFVTKARSCLSLSTSPSTQTMDQTFTVCATALQAFCSGHYMQTDSLLRATMWSSVFSFVHENYAISDGIKLVSKGISTALQDRRGITFVTHPP